MSATSTTSLGFAPAVLMRRKAAAMGLIGGAVAIALARALTNEGGSSSERLQQVAGHQAQITASAMLGIIGFAALIPGFFVIVGRIQQRGARLATIGAVLATVGCVGFAVLVSVDSFPTVAATQASPQSGMANFLYHLDMNPGLLILGPLATLGYFFGPFLIALGAHRAGLAAKWLPYGVLGALILQPIGLVIAGGPGTALKLLDTACQLVLVAVLAVLARTALSTE